MEELRWRKIKNKIKRLLNSAKKQGMQVSSLTTMETWKCALPLIPPVLRVPSAQMHCLSLFPELCLWEENRWNPLEANQASGESGAHGPLSKKAHECVLHVVIPLWMTSEYLFVFLQSPGITGRTTLPTVCNPNIKPKGFMCAKLSLSQLNCTLRLLKGKFRLTHLMAACR